MTNFLIALVAWFVLAFLALHFATPEASPAHNQTHNERITHD